MAAGPVIAIDIGGTKIAGGLVTPDGRISLLRHRPTEAHQGAEALLRRVIALAGELRQEAAVEPAAIGLGTAGFIQPETGVVAFATSALPGWQGTPVRQRLEQTLGLPAFVDNDVHVMALGEAVFGAGRGCRSMVGLTVGTGVGGGVIIDGQIYYGARGSAGAAGHLIIDYQGRRRCPCGRYGCLETYASATAMIGDFVRAAGKTFIRENLGLEPEDVGVKEIAGLAHSGEPIAWGVIRTGGRYLGIGIATLLNLLNPEMVVVGGGVAQIGETYFAAVRESARERALPHVAETPIVPALLGPEANLAGAAQLAWLGLK